MSAMTKREWMAYIEKTWDAAQKEAWSEPQFECPRCGHCCHIEEDMGREAMQMALDMLNEIADDVYCDQKLEGVITALRQALEKNT